MTIFDRLRKFDAYPKTLEEYRDKTIGGAAVTVTSAVLMVLLLLTELNNYLQPTISEDLFVDTTRSHKLNINLDLTIPRISCNYLSLDAMDSAGDQHLHIDHNIYKRRLDLEGNQIEEAKKEEILTSSTTKENVTESTSVGVVKCGSCYGAQVNDTHCCNTCQDVIDAYREKKWNPNTDDFEQCKNERFSDKSSEKLALKEGCQIYGHLEVNRMGGSFHIAPGKSFSLNHIHIHDVHPYSSTTFNTSHTITHLSFGERIHFANTHPLDNTPVYAKEGAMMFQYYIKIVPTVYEKLNGELTYTNQFSVTRHSKSVSVISGESGMPGIFFSYELSPLMVKYTEKQNSFGHFATNVCAIVGGIFTVAGIIDSIFHHSIYLIKKKIELGKLS
ncbi:endoplasmic reticulum-Golgi intermediate compartment protein 3 [Bradysia coprophila]|uniref:endoplasmic reticulum-Golgi intermediate compartment protein 3 n=1 Tax=Bradysia coprophila TaxID=38358 RepID=UPI00187DA801|nr:endoplasmic reticulum-Golgi intermediate compartment protein 3 [Bradysia coprophila]